MVKIKNMETLENFTPIIENFTPIIENFTPTPENTSNRAASSTEKRSSAEDEDRSPRERCSICLADIETTDRYKLECGHHFHTQCIVQWFRSCDEGPCPNCRAQEPHQLTFGDAQKRAMYLRKYARRQNAPHDLKKMVDQVRKKERFSSQCLFPK